MKRSMDLVRKILLAYEQNESAHGPGNLAIEGYTSDQIRFHQRMMTDAGLLSDDSLSVSVFKIGDSSITWAGYEFLDAARDENAWDRAKAAAGSAGGISFDVLKGVLVAIAAETAKRALGLSAH